MPDILTYEQEIENVAEEYVFGDLGYDICLNRCRDVAFNYGQDPSWSAVDFEDAVTNVQNALHREVVG